MLVPAAVIFDLDGTLVDSRGDIVASANHALVSTGRQPLSAQTIVRFVGDGARMLCARAANLPESSEEVDVLVRKFIGYYIEHPIDFARWMPGAEEALNELGEIPDISIGICTNKPRATTDAVLSALGVRSRFHAIVAGGDIEARKPSPEPLVYLAKKLGIEVREMVMVGDSPQDIECARRAGAKAVAIAAGFCTHTQLADAKPDVLIESMLELRDVIRRWRDSTERTIKIGNRE